MYLNGISDCNDNFTIGSGVDEIDSLVYLQSR